MKKLLSFLTVLSLGTALAAPAMAANVTTSGGNSSVPVELTAEAAIFNVTVPTTLPISVDASGVVTTATDAKIVNNGHGAVRVTGLSVTSAASWVIEDYDTFSPGAEKVSTKKVALEINSDKTTGANAISFTPTNFPKLDGANTTASDELPIVYNAKIPAQGTALTDVSVATIVFTVGWDV